jgi:hypothetical protein
MNTMKHQFYNNKRIIWESKTRQIGVIVIAGMLVAIAIWAKESYHALLFWGTLVCCGGGGLYMVGRLLNPNNIFVKPRSTLAKLIHEADFEKARADLGFFAYDDAGFHITLRDGTYYYRWNDIETIFGYKQDFYTYEEICLDLFTKDNVLTLTESIPGWYQFNDRLSQHFETISTIWQLGVMDEALNPNFTLLYDINGRTQEEAQAARYKA